MAGQVGLEPTTTSLTVRRTAIVLLTIRGGSGNRTHDPLLAKQMRYRTAPYPQRLDTAYRKYVC